MTHAAAAYRSPSAPELEMLLQSSRRGDPAQHGRAQAERAARASLRTAGALAGVVWAFDLWLVLGHAF
jgi:hypothetical protein